MRTMSPLPNSSRSKPRDGNRPCNRLTCPNRTRPPQTQSHPARVPKQTGRTPQGVAMSDKPKVLIFAPREEPPETIKAIEGLGCELVIGNRDWQLPRTHYEDDVVAQA